MSEDPATTFFPDVEEIPSLYQVLGVQSDCSQDDLKRAYRRLSLLHHPDKVAAAASSSSSGGHDSTQQATLRFQQIGFAYSVLKDAARREKYDLTGSTVEMSAKGAKTEAEWRDYFKELWSGEVSAQSIAEFKKKYQGSDEERSDVLAAYESSAGDLDAILASVMVSTIEDEDRFVDLINQAIASGTVKSTPEWKKHLKDTKGKGKERRRKKADKEAKEAEELAKELGVHDKLFGGTGAGAKTSESQSQGQGAKKGKGKGKEGGKGASEADAEDGEAALRALIQGNQAKRMNSLVDSLEAKYAAIETNKKSKQKGKKRASTGDGGDEEGGGDASAKRPRGKKDREPTEEEFAAIQAQIDARRNGTTKSK